MSATAVERQHPAAALATKNATAATAAASTKTSPPGAASTSPTVDCKARFATSGNPFVNHHRFGPSAQMWEAEAAINAVEVRSATHWAILRLIEAAIPVVQAAESDSEHLQAATDRLDEALAVIDAVENGLDDHLVYGAGTLITLAKVQIDAKLEDRPTVTQSAPQVQPVAASGPYPDTKSVAPSELLSAIQEAYTLISEACAVLKCGVVGLPSPVGGAFELLTIACDAFCEASESGKVDDCERAGAALAVALEVLDVTSERAADLVVDAALRLATQARATLDVEIKKMIGEADAGMFAQISTEIDAKGNDFQKGRDLAIKMLKAGEELDYTDQADPMRWVREGAAQNRFVLPFLQHLCTEPALMDGFAAVLSGRLGTGECVRYTYFDVPEAEYRAGVVGEDGTAADGGDHEDVANESISFERPTAATAHTSESRHDDACERRALALDANHQISQLAGVLKQLLEAEPTDKLVMYHGMLSRIEQLGEVTYYAAGLHGEDDSVVGYPGTQTLTRLLHEGVSA